MKIKILFVLIFLGHIFSNCNQKEAPKSPEELKMELEMLEQESPAKYINVNCKMFDSIVRTRRAGIFHDAEYKVVGKNIKGVIKNTATLARFKDLVVTVAFFSKTKTVIQQNDYTLYEFYEPNSEKSFMLYVKPPEDTNGFDIVVKSAVSVD
ncbi:hypothetical protein D3C87_59750 [compost metagenome]